MEVHQFASNLGQTLELDICFACQGLWFDRQENLKLTPAAVVELFRLLHEHRTDQHRPLHEPMACPRCNTTLAKGFDVVVHDECTADVNDLKVVERVLAPHKAGLPAVVIHCGMHSFRTEGFPKATAIPWPRSCATMNCGSTGRCAPRSSTTVPGCARTT